jgi:hypothetical protein
LRSPRSDLASGDIYVATGLGVRGEGGRKAAKHPQRGLFCLVEQGKCISNPALPAAQFGQPADALRGPRRLCRLESSDGRRELPRGLDPATTGSSPKSLARAIEADDSGRAEAALDRSAPRCRGGAERPGLRGLSPGASTVQSLLVDRGYEPYDDEGVIRLRNCPFDQLANAHRELVCRADLAFVEGLLEGHLDSGMRAVLDPRPEQCCVALV